MQSIPASAGTDAIFEAYRKDGAVIIKNFINADQVERFSNEVRPSLEALNFPQRTGDPEGDHLNTTSLGEESKRLGQLVNHSAVFRHELLENSLMHSLLVKVFVQGPLDGYWLNASELIEITPGSPAQTLHRDQELYPAWDCAVTAMPEAICNFIVAMTPFTELNGAIQVALGTHRLTPADHILDSGFRLRVDLKTTAATMNPGDCIFLSGKVVHGGGANNTETEKRRGLAMSFVNRILVPETAHAFLVPREIADTMTYRGQAMLGFRSQWPVSRGMPSFYWGHQGEEIGRFIGLAEKTVSNM